MITTNKFTIKNEIVNLNVPHILRTYAVQEFEVSSMSIGPLVRKNNSGST